MYQRPDGEVEKAYAWTNRPVWAAGPAYAPPVSRTGRAGLDLWLGPAKTIDYIRLVPFTARAGWAFGTVRWAICLPYMDLSYRILPYCTRIRGVRVSSHYERCGPKPAIPIAAAVFHHSL